jgi:uncharacterized protein (DUF2235 family)
MPKNIVILSDGTGQAGGIRPDQNLSNIYKLYRAVRVGPDNEISPKDQIAFYDPGVGTEGDEGKIPLRPVQWFLRVWSAATGAGLSRNIADCYEAIIKHYEPGDRIFLFGFSRGAFTARCVGGVMSLCGVPTRAADGGLLPRYGTELRKIADEAVDQIYEHGNGWPESNALKGERLEKARRFRQKYGCEEVEHEGKLQAKVVPHFVGVFDTVAAVGAKGKRQLGFLMLLELFLALMSAASASVLAALTPLSFWVTLAQLNLVFLFGVFATEFWNRLKWITRYNGWLFKPHFAAWNYKFHDRSLNTRVTYARHALAIDEDRKDFDRVQWGNLGAVVPRGDRPEWLRQIWFAGNHSDIGGSYKEDESRLSDIALDWMVTQATELPEREQLLVDRSRLNMFPSSSGMQHSESLQAQESPFAVLFKWPCKARKITADAPLHQTVIQRFDLHSVSHYGRAQPYRPENLRSHSAVRQYFEEHGDTRPN